MGKELLAQTDMSRHAVEYFDSVVPPMYTRMVVERDNLLHGVSLPGFANASRSVDTQVGPLSTGGVAPGENSLPPR